VFISSKGEKNLFCFAFLLSGDFDTGVQRRRISGPPVCPRKGITKHRKYEIHS